MWPLQFPSSIFMDMVANRVHQKPCANRVHLRTRTKIKNIASLAVINSYIIAVTCRDYVIATAAIYGVIAATSCNLIINTIASYDDVRLTFNDNIFKVLENISFNTREV